MPNDPHDQPRQPSENTDIFNAASRGQPASRVQIEALNALRPTLQPLPAYTMDGAEANIVRRDAARARNQAIDRTIAFMERQLKRQLGKAKSAQKRSAERRTQQRRQQDRER